jgi:hypothetical protein
MSGQPMQYSQDQDGYPIDLNRPLVPVDGGMGTEYQMTIDHNGRWYNVPTIWGGQVLPPREAYKMARQAISAGGWPFPNYPTLDQAEKAAGERSKTIGKKRNM